MNDKNDDEVAETAANGGNPENNFFVRYEETEAEFRVVVDACSYRSLLVYLFHGKRVRVTDYRVTRHCVCFRRVGAWRLFSRFDVTGKTGHQMFQYLCDGHDSRSLTCFDELKYAICGHTIYRYDSHVPHMSNVRWPRVFVCKRSVELRNAFFSPDLTRFLEVDGSDANLGVVHARRIEMLAENGVRVGLYSFMDDFSEVRYELALEREFSTSELTDETFARSEAFFYFISSYFYDFIEPWLTYDLRTPIDPLLVNKSEHFMRVVSASNVSDDGDESIRVVGYKRKLDGVRLFATFDGKNLVMSDGSRTFISARNRCLFGTDFVYQIEKFDDAAICVTEICAVRNTYMSVQNSLAHGFYSSDVMRNKMRTEQKFPYGLLGLGLPEQVVSKIENDLRAVDCTLVDCNNSSVSNSLLRVGPLQSSKYCAGAHIVAHSVRLPGCLRFNLLHSSPEKCDGDGYDVTPFPSDGYLALVQSSALMDSVCVFGISSQENTSMYYVKKKERQSIELRFVSYVDESGERHSFFAALDGKYMFERNGIWCRYDGESVDLKRFDANNYRTGDIVEFLRNSVSCFEVLRLRNDKLMPDCFEKVDAIVFDRGYDDRNEVTNDETDD